jgi:hypothetical protein
MRTSYDTLKRCPDTNHAFFSKLLGEVAGVVGIAPIAVVLLLFASPGCFPFCPTRSLGRRDSFARRRGHRASFLRRPNSPGLSSHSSETSQGCQRCVQLLHFPLHAVSFLPQLLDYSSQAPHGFPPRSSIVPAGGNWMDSQTPFPIPNDRHLRRHATPWNWDLR